MSKKKTLATFKNINLLFFCRQQMMTIIAVTTTTKPTQGPMITLKYIIVCTQCVRLEEIDRKNSPTREL